jgi:hypothetical protein
MHRWLLGTPNDLFSWRGERPIRLVDQKRYLIVVHAVRDGKCALFDPQTNELVPFDGM